LIIYFQGLRAAGLPDFVSVIQTKDLWTHQWCVQSPFESRRVKLPKPIAFY